jgi:flagella basal body P-ring formation protein FlgA
MNLYFKIIFTLLIFVLHTSLYGFEMQKNQRAKIFLIDHISVEAPLVTLGEISKIETVNPILKKKIASLEICELPLLGNEQLITNYKVQQALKNNGFSSSIEVHGLQSIVSTQEKIISSQTIQEIIENWIQNKNDNSIQAEIDFIKLPRKWKIPQGEDVNIVIKGPSSLSNRINISLKAIYNGKIYSSQTAKINIKYFQEVSVLNRPLSKGDLLKEENISLQYTDVTNSLGKIPYKITDFIGMKARKRLRIGSIINSFDFEQPTAVEKGSYNRIIVVNGDIVMRLGKARALKNGKVGEIIPFINPINKQETLHAKIIKTGLAVMELK